MTRAEYYQKLEELKKLIGQLEGYCADEETKFWNCKDEDFNYRISQEMVRLAVAKSSLHTMGTMSAFNLNI